MHKDKISLPAAILMNINVIIGAGIFVAPAIIAQQASYLSFLGFPLVGIIFLPIVLSTAQMTKYFPGISSFYNYSKNGLNQTVGFIGGWLYYLGYSAVCATLIVVLQEILANQLQLKLIKDYPVVFIAAFIILLCYLSLFNIQSVSKIQSSATAFKSLPLIFVILIFVFYWNSNLTLNFDFDSLKKLFTTIPFVFFAYSGFEASCNISHLIVNSEKNSSRAILGGFLITAVIFTLFSLGLLHIMGPENLAQYQVANFPKFLGITSPFIVSILTGIVSAAISVSYASSAFGAFVSNSANLHAIASDKLLPFSSKLIHTNKNNRPDICIWTKGVTVFLFAYLIRSKEILTAVADIGIVASYIITFAALFNVQLKRKVGAKLITTLLTFVSCLILLYYSYISIAEDFATRIMYMLPLLILAILGIIMFKFNKKSSDISTN